MTDSLPSTLQWIMGNVNTIRRRRQRKAQKERNELKAKLGTRKVARLRTLLRRLSESQNHRCCYCGDYTWMEGIEDSVKRNKCNRATLEHINPRINGGTFGKYNLVMACHECNNARGTMDLDKFITLISREVGPVYRRHVKQNKKKQTEKALKTEARKRAFTFTLALYYRALSDFDKEIWEQLAERFSNHKNEVTKRKIKAGARIDWIRERIKKNGVISVGSWPLPFEATLNS